MTWRQYRADEKPQIGDVVRQSCCDWAFSSAIISSAFLGVDGPKYYNVSRPHCRVTETGTVFTAVETWIVSEAMLPLVYEVACDGLRAAITGEESPRDNRSM
jgi:hypothetical protein